MMKNTREKANGLERLFGHGNSTQTCSSQHHE